MEKLVVMTSKELRKCGLIQQAEEKRVSQMNAAEMLGISDRHFRRLLKAYREEGVNGLLSKKEESRVTDVLLKKYTKKPLIF